MMDMKYKTTSYIVISAILIAAIATVATNQTLLTSNKLLFVQQAVAQQQHASTGNAATTNEPQRITLDGINLSFEVEPKVVHASDLVTAKMTITDEESGKVATHVDWSITVKTPSGKEVYKSSTLHSHVGIMDISYAFLEPGKNTVSVQVASLGPKMMGMDVPAMAQTRVLKSGDPMMGWQTDPNLFFGTRTAQFTVNVGSQGGVKVLDGSEPNTKIKLELSSNPARIIAGQPTTLILNVIQADNGMNIIHPDALFTIRQGLFRESASAAAGNPMMPMNGAFHGHTGEIAVTTVFPSPGMYSIDLDVNSLPVSNYIFGKVHTTFRVFVSDGGGTGSSLTTSTATTLTEPNHVAILGQDPPFYSPSNIKVKAGIIITFKNQDAIIHTVMGTDDALNTKSPTANNLFDTGLLKMGEEKEITFDKPGTYNYFCQIHPFMQGTVTVTG
jgi:plastocyanin